MAKAGRGKQHDEQHDEQHEARRAQKAQKAHVPARSARGGTRGATSKAEDGHSATARSQPPSGAAHGKVRAAEPRTISPRPLDVARYTGPPAPQIAAPAWQRRIVVERPADLAALARELAGAHVVALDAEFAQSRVRAQDEPPHRLAVLQLAFDNDYRASYVVDALRLADLSPLRAIFANHRILKVFHGIGADARVLATRELVARNTLDIEAVSRSLFGQHESGLQSMLQRAAGVRLDKSLQRADWSRRPLSPPMVAYAARDAEMTYALYRWLTTNYPAMVALHHIAAEEPEPNVAGWIVPYLEGSRPKPAAAAVAEAGIAGDRAAQQRDLRAALAAVRHPPQRARVMRLIADLDLRALADDLRVYLEAPAAEERAGAARTIGRLGDRSAILALRALLHDSVQDVRQAAQVALEHLENAPRRALPRAPRTPQTGADARAARGGSGGRGAVRWSSDNGADGESSGGAEWQQRLRQRYGQADTTSGE